MNTRRNKQSRIFIAELSFVVLSLAMGLETNALGADNTRSVNGDVFVVDARASTYLRMFQRALLPGPAGAIVTNDRLTLVYEDVALRVQGLDSPISEPNSLDFELAAWGGYTVGAPGYERALDGDLSVINVSQRIGNGFLRLGRQIYVGGASRFAQFDGIAGGVRTMGDWGQIGIDVYGGATVLPRWSSRPGYYQLGSATDTLLRYPESLPKPERAGTWQSGTRAYGTLMQYGGIGVSFHEQRENGLLFARKVGFDASIRPFSAASLSAQSVFDIDGQSVADSRVWLDVYPFDHWSFGVEYLRTNPALFLSKQSVLNVFASDPFSEVGGDVDYRPNRVFSVGLAAYLDRFDTSGFGSRMQGRTQITHGNVTLQFALGRVAEPRNGYFSSRESLRWLVSQIYAITFDHYVYFYDQSIAGLGVSSVESATGEWQVSSATRIAISGSLIQSPYTVLDLQGLCRLTVDLGRKPKRSQR